MAGFFGKLIKGLLLGAGTVLSVIPGGVAIGAPLIVAGAAINTKTAGSQDVLSVYAGGLINQVSGAASMQSAANRAAFWDNAMDWISKNMMIVLIAAGALLFMLFRKKRR